MTFYELINDAYPKVNIQTIEDYVMDDFDYYAFLEGRPFEGQIPKQLKLYIRKGEEKLPQASLLGGSLSWLIFSESLVDYWWPMIKDDVQVFDAPVYYKNGKRVKGYKIINPVRVIDCIDWDKTKERRREDGTILGIGKIYIIAKKIGEHHIFMPDKCKYTVIVSEKLAKSLAGKNFNGIAFLRCNVS